MGVHGLWNLLEPVGKPVPLEALENKVLAVDVSIWLHQATKGFRDAQGNPLPNAHLLGLCHRLCKLLFFKIKPVFVFDGGVPILKRQTMALRHSRRDTVVKNNNIVAEKILANYIKSEVINRQLGKPKGKFTAPMLKKKKTEPDLFELPPLPNSTAIEEETLSDSDSETGETSEDLESVSFHMKGHNIHSVDFSSEAFRALPVAIQHEILLELRDTRKQSSWNKIHQMPQEADGFSGFQMERLLKRRNLQQRLDEVVKEIGQKTHAEFAVNKGGIAESYKIASDSSTHCVLIKKALEHVNKPLEDTAKKVSSIFIQDKKVDNIEDIEMDEEFSQQELFAILGSNEQKNQPIICTSSSDEDSDLEEVPPSMSPPVQKIILDIPISPTLAYQEEDDMFADIFGPMSLEMPEMKKSIRADIEKVENDSLMLKEPKVIQTSSSNQSFENKISPAVIEKVNTKENSSQLQKMPFPDIVKPGVCQVLETAPEANGGILDSHSVSHEALRNVKTAQLEKNNAPSKEDELYRTEGLKTLASSNENKDFAELEQNSFFGIMENEEETETIGKVENRVDSNFVTKEDDNTTHDATKEGFQVANVLPSTSKFSEPLALNPKRKEELEEMGRIINQEQSDLIHQHGRQERLGATITDQMYIESQELLRLFGIPYVVAPMEAEAQCAFLDEAGLTQGTITDDSDIWLFGGRRVYKNFFNQGKYVEFFEADDIHKVFKLGREKLVHLALLTGSDYTEGIQGVGPVCALEILAEFPSQGLDALEQFRDWLHSVQSKKNAPPENKIRQKIRNLQVKPGFPNRAVVEAYTRPEVNQSRAKFSWADPNVDALRDFLNEKIGWNREKFNSVVVPVLERFKSKECQTRIDSYFSVKFPSKTATIVSKRVMNALQKADFGGNVETEEHLMTTSASKVKATIGKRQWSERSNVGNKKVKSSSVTLSGPTASTSGEAEIIWQKESDKKKLEANKLKAIELFKKSKSRGKRPALRPASSRAHLSESDSDSS